MIRKRSLWSPFTEKKIHVNAREGYKDSRVNWRVWSQKKWDTSRTLDSIKTTIKWNEFWILADHGLRKFMLNIILLRNICIRIHLYVKEADQTHQKVEKSWNKMVSRNKTWDKIIRIKKRKKLGILEIGCIKHLASKDRQERPTRTLYFCSGSVVINFPQVNRLILGLRTGIDLKRIQELIWGILKFWWWRVQMNVGIMWSKWFKE